MATAEKKGGKASHLYLHEKDPDTWEIVDEGAWGKMKFYPKGSEFDLVFNGHGLEEDYDYTLIYYPDPWPGNELIVFGSDIADEEGNVHIKAKVDTGDLEDAKIWLVLTDDVDYDNQKMVGWNPTEYLFEHNLIDFEDTD